MTEQISTFLDGEISRQELDKNIHKLLSDKNVRQTYREYQSIGDIMRGQALTNSADLSKRIMASIEGEPTVLSPNAIQAPSEISHESINHESKTIPSSWSMVASIAAVMVVGFFTWQSVPREQVTLAQVSDTVTQPVTASATSNRVAAIDAIPAYYLEAHRVSAPSVGSHYIQTVNYSE